MAKWNGGPAGQELVVDRLESPRHTRATSNWHVLAIKVTHPMGWVKRQAHHGPTLNQTWTSRDKCVCWLKGEIDGHLTQRQNEKRKEKKTIVGRGTIRVQTSTPRSKAKPLGPAWDEARQGAETNKLWHAHFFA